MRKLILCACLGLPLLLSATPHENLASIRCTHLLEEARAQVTGIETPQSRRLTFKKVQVLRRNNDFGMQQEGTLEVVEWISLPGEDEKIYNDVGLTADGRVYHILHDGDRSVARLLSGTQNFRKIFIFRESTLGALDENGNVWLYSSVQWSRSPVRNLIKRGFALWAAVTTTTSVAASALEPEFLTLGPEFHGWVVSVPLSVVAVASALSTGTFVLNNYDRLNTFPDGFILAASRLEELESMDLKQFQFDYKFTSFARPLRPVSIPYATEEIRR